MHEHPELTAAAVSRDDDLLSNRPPAANDDKAAEPETHVFLFTGSGKEYFRIWIVNLFLSVATLGIYSAWAKVRRLQYFDRNTQLAGAAFDFRGNPKAILKGRVLALAVLATYQFAFGLSIAVGLAIVGFLMVALPFFMRSALRFRLHNTHYRGLRFDFGGTPGGAYGAWLPPLLTVLLPGMSFALDPSGKLAALAMLLYLLWPLMHGAMKRYQHRHLLYGSMQSGFEVPKRRFYKPYLMALLMTVGGLIVLGVLLGITIYLLSPARGSAQPVSQAAVFLPLVMMVLSMYVFYLVAGPYLQVRIANLAWSNTAFPGIEIVSRLKAREFVRLQTVNALLTLLTLGLYRPFAVVRVYRYRLAHVSVRTHGSFEGILAGAARRRTGAAGDGMADFLGVDISW